MNSFRSEAKVSIIIPMEFVMRRWKRRVIVVCMFALVCSVCHSQVGNSVLLPASETARLIKSNSVRGGTLGGYWQPTDAELAALDANVPKIAKLRSEGVIVGAQIADPTKDHKQYVTFTLDGKRMIYVNGFCIPPMKEWKSRLEVVMDGGPCFWRVLYDVNSQTFSRLMTNGRA